MSASPHSLPLDIPLGPVMVGVRGMALDDEDRARLSHPLVGGVILFTRNYESPAQLLALTSEIHALRAPPLLIAVDHEGGRVQRFRQGFTVLPAMGELGVLWDQDEGAARRAARQVGHVLAAELRAHGVDLSFAPVLDMDYGRSSVIGDRAFHKDPHVIAELALALAQGLKQGGMSSVGKHFPGHGHVQADSHHALPIDERPYPQIQHADILPFRKMIANGLGGIMPAHVIYTAVDERPAGFSTIWLKRILREELAFDGMIFSDDLTMVGAHWAGGITERANAAFDAGCDMALVCNDFEGADTLLAGLTRQQCHMPPVALARLGRIHGRGGRGEPGGHAQLVHDAEYQEALAAVREISVHRGELPLYRT